MESPRVIAAGHAGLEAFTPGASVAAQHGDRYTSVFDTPGPPSPGQASPHQDGARPTNMGRAIAGLEAAAAALTATDGKQPRRVHGDAEPLSRPRLRVQGADIILEDASSPKDIVPAAAAAAAPNGVAPPAVVQQSTAAGTGTATASLVAAAAAAAHHGVQQSAAAASQQQQQQQQQQGGHQPSTAAGRAAQSHELELQLRLASRSATGVSNVAMGGSKAHLSQAAHAHTSAEERTRGQEGGGGGGEPDKPSGSSAAAADGPVRMKYRSTLTEENVAYLNKLDQYSSRPDSSERIWRWLEGSGPPFDNPPPSLGVPTVSKSHTPGGSKRPGGKRGGFLSCFACFGGTQEQQQ